VAWSEQVSFVLDEDLSFLDPSVEAPAVRVADLKNDQFPSGRPSLASLDPRGRLGRLDPLAFARYLITFSIGVAIALAWQSYGGTGGEPIAPAAHSPDQQQFDAMSINLDAMRQSVDRIANNMALNQEQMTHSVSQLAAGQEWMTREIADLQTFEQYVLDKISLPQPRPTHATPRNLAPRSSQAPVALIPARDR
jgi:hypothetical protein